jgi:hypothetical protein
MATKECKNCVSHENGACSKKNIIVSINATWCDDYESKSFKLTILDTIEDLCSNFLYYDRKGDEQLSMEQLNEAVKTEQITIDEMVSKFRTCLENTFNNKE